MSKKDWYIIAFFTTLFLFGCDGGVDSGEGKSQIPEVKGPWGNETEYPITDTKMSNAGGGFIWLDDDNLLFVGRKTRQFISFEEDERQGGSLYVWNQRKKFSYSVMDFDWEKKPGKFCHYKNGNLIVRLYEKGSNFPVDKSKRKYHKMLFSKAGERYKISKISNLGYDETKKIVGCGPVHRLIDKSDKASLTEVKLDEVGGLIDWYRKGKPVYINKNGTLFHLKYAGSRESVQNVSWLKGYFYGKASEYNLNDGGLLTYFFGSSGEVESKVYPMSNVTGGGIGYVYLTKAGVMFWSNEKRNFLKHGYGNTSGLYILSERGDLRRVVQGEISVFAKGSISPSGCFVAFAHYPEMKDMDTEWHMLEDESIKIVGFCQS